MERIFVKPAEGATVRSPQHNDAILPADGKWVDNSPYWQRRLLDKDVSDCSKEQLAIEAAAAKAAKKGEA